jgi:hypothetical protein
MVHDAGEDVWERFWMAKRGAGVTSALAVPSTRHQARMILHHERRSMSNARVGGQGGNKAAITVRGAHASAAGRQAIIRQMQIICGKQADRVIAQGPDGDRLQLQRR